MFLPLWLQVDVGCSGGFDPDNRFQRWGFDLLLCLHLSLRAVVEDVPQQRPGLPPYPGTLPAPLASREVILSLLTPALLRWW